METENTSNSIYEWQRSTVYDLAAQDWITDPNAVPPAHLVWA